MREWASGIPRSQEKDARNLDSPTLEVKDAAGWRAWLRKNHLKEQGVWLVYRRKGTAAKSVSYEESVDEALAYGWIDSLIKKINDEKYARKFTPRKPLSIWSGTNIERVDKLRKEGRMTRWGLAAFAKRTQEVSPSERIDVDDLATPSDFEDALRANKTAWDNFERFTPGYRKRYLMWILTAKKPETRNRRIAEAVSLISRNVKELLK